MLPDPSNTPGPVEGAKSPAPPDPAHLAEALAGSEHRLQFLVTLNDKLRPLSNPVEIQETAARLLGKHLRVNRISYADIDGDEFVVNRPYYADGVAPFVGRGPIDTFGKALLDAYRRGETVAVSDVRNDARLTDIERAGLLASEIAAFVGVMLHKDGRWLAAFGVHSATPRAWTLDEIALIEATGERTWSTAERARAEDALRRSEERQAFLLRLSDTIRPLGDPAKILAEACRLLGSHLHVNRVAYGEIDGEACIVIDDYVDGVASMAGRFRWSDLADSRTEEILQGGILVANDTATDPQTARERQALKAAEIGAYLSPVLIKDGRLVASFGIHSRTPRVWTKDEITLVQEVADRIWATLEQRKAEAALRASEDRLAFLLALNDTIRPLSDPFEAQEAAARLLGEYLRVARVGYAEIDGSEFIIRRAYARDVEPLVGQGPIALFGAALGEAYRPGDAVVVNDVLTDPRFTEPERAALKAMQIVAFVGVTLVKGGRLVAGFGASDATPRVWTHSEIDLVRDVAERTWEAVERARAEAALREREERLRLALDASAAGSWTWDARTNQVDWDDGFRKRYGFSPEEPPAFDTWLARVHEEDRPKVLRLLDDVLHSTTRVAWDNSFRIVRPDGTVSWMQSLGRADRDADGAVTRLTGLELDITKRRRGEEALQARRDEERDRELRLLLETATQGIVLVDARGTIVTANRAIETMFGWAPGELIGQSVERLVPSFLRDRHTEHRNGYFAAPHPRLMGGGLDLVGERRDGSTFPIEVSLNHVATSGGGQVIAFVTDITDRRRAEAVLQERTAELERRTTQLRQLASDLTLAEQHAREELAKTLHDGLQQVLALAALNLDQQLKLDRRQTNAAAKGLVEVRGYLDEAIDEARSLSFELYPPVLQSSGLPAALSWLANRTRDKYGLEVEVSADPLANSARKDVRTLLFESVRELLFNAFKHAQVDRVAVDLVRDSDDMLCITVTDQGIGFDPAEFEARAKASRVGWGLFSIRERLTLLGGRFDIDSAPGRGTRFRLTAPRGGPQGAAAEQDAPSHAAIAVVSRDAAGPASELKILIVDDHAAVRKVFREILEGRPEFRVVGDASNGVEAIARAHALRPDVVLMDVSMPHMDGIEATRRLRAELPFIQILGLSLQPRTPTPHPIEQAGAAGFYTKGVDTERLIDHLLAIHVAATLGLPGPST